MDLLVSVSTTVGKKKPIQVIPEANESKPKPSNIETLEDALEILKTQPDSKSLENALRFLSEHEEQYKKPTALSAKIVNTLVNTTVPDFWSAFDSGAQRSLTKCLFSVTGLGAVLARLKALVTDATQSKKLAESRNVNQHITDVLQVLSMIITDSESVLGNLWDEMARYVSSEAQRRVLWREAIVTCASGRIIGLVAQAEQVTDTPTIHQSWMSQGSAYAKWLGRNIATMANHTLEKDQERRAAVAQLIGRSLSLGYTNQVISEFWRRHIIADPGKHITSISDLLGDLKAHERRQVFDICLNVLPDVFGLSVGSSQNLSVSKDTAKKMEAVAALINWLIKENKPLGSHLLDQIVKGNGAIDGSINYKRAILRAVAEDEESIQAVLERSIQQLGDQLYIKHTPIIQQEALTQTLLISAGYVHRMTRMHAFVLGRSSHHTQGVSNRLAASSPRARFLGMVVGVAMSELIDKPEIRMKFDVEELETDEAQWYLQLIHIQDDIGSLEDPKIIIKRQSEQSEGSLKPNAPATIPIKKAPTPATVNKPPVAKPVGPKIIEVLSEDEDEDEDMDDLKPYGKPDSDPEDESEDPTLVNRDKPKPPVYIRDLMAGLRDTENHDRYELAVSHAANLIIRKTSFGREVLDNVEELASILAGLQDPYDFDDFIQMRQDALIAILLASPAEMGPWFASSFFGGDYSISQRIAMLTAMGLGARQLAGFKEDSNDRAPKADVPFPSKSLPEKMHNLYISAPPAVNTVARRLEQNMIRPMALQAADEMTGPNVLKVRTFSSRIEKEKQREKPIPNELAKIVAQSFFFPLTGRWWATVQGRGGRSSVFTQPMLLQCYLRTLAILLHASGPSTLSLPQMTSELWDLLLSLRTAALGDVALLEGLLFATLTLLNVNEDKQRLATEHGKEIMETQEWVKLVLEAKGGVSIGVNGGGKEEDERVKMLAAAVAVRCGEVVEKWQRVMLGDMVDYM